MHYIIYRDSPLVFVHQAFAIIFPIWTPAEQKQKPFNGKVSKTAGKKITRTQREPWPHSKRKHRDLVRRFPTTRRSHGKTLEITRKKKRFCRKKNKKTSASDNVGNKSPLRL